MTEPVRRVLLSLVVLVLVAAVGVGIWARPGGPGDSSGDVALVDQLLARSAQDVDGVLADAAAIRDPVLRQLAIDEWVHRNASRLSQPDGERICLTMEGTTRDVCLRKVSSPHLHQGPGK